MAGGGRARRIAPAAVSWRMNAVMLLLALLTTLHSGSGSSSGATTVGGQHHPVSRHVGRWGSPPRKCPSEMVTDAPIMANGDMGAAVCDGAAGKHGLSFFLGKMDFWTQSHGPEATYKTPRHLATHVAAGFVTVSTAAVSSQEVTAPVAAAAMPAPPVWNCSLFHCSCEQMTWYYGVWPGVGFGCAPPPAQAWWKARACRSPRPAVGCCKGPACSFPGAAPCARGCSGHHPPPPAPPTPKPGAAGFAATQVLQSASIHVTRSAAGHPTLNVSSIVAAEQNVLLTRLTVDRPAVLELTLGVANPMDLPTKAKCSGTALTLDRAANAWLDNSAVLLECDAGMSPSYALRGIQLDPVTNRLRFINASAPGQFVCPVVAPHPIYGPNTISSVICAAANEGSDVWIFNSSTGTVRQFSSASRPADQLPPQPPPTCVEMVYSTNKSTNFVLLGRSCDEPGAAHGTTDSAEFSNQFDVVASPSLPEGGVTMLKAIHMSNHTAPGGASKKWIADGGCVALVKPNLNITMGLASWLYDEHDQPLEPMTQPNCSGNRLSASAQFKLSPHVHYVHKTSIQTNRPPKAITMHQSAVERARETIDTHTTAELEATHASWWARWWNMSSVDLGPQRQVLESFYYGAHYMLGSFSRVGGVTAGLLGPWSMQDPIGLTVVCTR